MAEQPAAPAEPYPFLKGHGTQNDFVLLPDHDGRVHGDLTPARVRALCDRRAGLGADGVLRVLRRDDGWFMDYRNADGSVSEMCGNGVRVFALHLLTEGLVAPDQPVEVHTRDGVKVVTREHDGRLTVDMGTPRLLGETVVGLGEREWPARHVDMGNPHAVVLLGAGEAGDEGADPLESLGGVLAPPRHDRGVYPDGVNVEFVVDRGPRHVAMRVHERGSGETRSCGTGACAVMVAAAERDGAPRDAPYRVGLPGGTREIVRTAEDRVRMTGPAVLVARGTTAL